MANTAVNTGTVYTEDQKLAIEQELHRIIGNSHFSHSKRFPSFLRFIIQAELEGRGEQLKERTLGVEVFGRPPGYDTTADPIVRVTAAEIRKRIAQYYQEPGHAAEVRISLPPGSYIPHFEWPDTEPAPPLVLAAGLSTAPSPEPGRPATPPARKTSATLSTRRWVLAALVLIAVSAALALAGAWQWHRARPSALDLFWTPVLGADSSVVVCFPLYKVETMSLRSAADPELIQRFEESTSAVNVDDLDPLVSLTGLLEMRHKRFVLMGQDTATLTDLRRGPTIFLGAFDNAWALRVTRGLRFRFGNDAEMKHFWIEDTQGAHTHWQIDRRQQVSTNNYRDYAIVARFADASTGQLAVVSAGITRGGTVAAGEFLSRPQNMELLRAHAPADWDRKNMEFVLSTEIIDGRSAPPRIEAMYFW